MAEGRGLTRDADFLKFWIGETISDFGDQITLLAIPLTAVIVLHASAFEMGLLTAAGTLPTALFSLPAGVWVDRLRRRPILIIADVGRALALATVPLAFVAGILGLPQLYAVAFIAGTLSTFFVVAYQSYLPALVGPGHLVDANGRMNATSSIAQMAGPSLGGVLVQLFTAPMPVVVDALSFVASAVGVTAIRRQEPRPVARPRNMRAEIREGVAALLGHPALRAITVGASLAIFFYSAQLALFLLYLSRDVQLAPSVIGFVLGIGSVGALAGAVVAARVARMVGIGPSFVFSACLMVAGFVGRTLIDAPTLLAIPTIAAAQFIGFFGFAMANVTNPALRQALTPPALLGRVNASYRFLAWGTGPLGAVFGGTLAQIVGLHEAVLVCGLATAIILPILIRSPLMQLRSLAPRTA